MLGCVTRCGSIMMRFSLQQTANLGQIMRDKWNVMMRFSTKKMSKKFCWQLKIRQQIQYVLPSDSRNFANFNHAQLQIANYEQFQ